MDQGLGVLSRDGAIVRPFALADALTGAVQLEGVVVEYRPLLFDAGSSLFFTAAPGATVAQIVAGIIAGGKMPRPFPAYGTAFVGGEVQHADVVPPDMWHAVRPKAGAVLFLGPLPANGDNAFAQIAGLAVAAFAIAISGGALASLAPALFGGTGALAFFGAGAGAQLLGAGIATAGFPVSSALVKA